MNPALHVAHYAMAGAAVRHSQMTGDLIQSCTINVIEPRVVIVCVSLAIGLGLYFGCKISFSSQKYMAEYWSNRINQFSKTLKK